MALSKLQSDILRLLAKNRSETSYLAGGLMLNKDWRRRSDDIDIFHDTDEEVTETAKADLALLEAARFKTHRDFIIYGWVDATISREDESTIIPVASPWPTAARCVRPIASGHGRTPIHPSL